MKLRNIVAAVAAVFATSALAAGDPSNQRPSQGSGSGGTTQSQNSGGAMTQSQGTSGSGMAQGSTQAQSPEVVRQAQQQLNNKGYDVGAVDGQLGPKTSEGLKKFQEAENLKATGRLDRQTLAALGVDRQSSGRSTESSSPGRSTTGGSGSSSGASGGTMNQPGSGGSSKPMQ